VNHASDSAGKRKENGVTTDDHVFIPEVLDGEDDDEGTLALDLPSIIFVFAYPDDYQVNF
jgi:hypothetical protein